MKVVLDRPLQSLLFVCSMNSVRSPMAEALAKAEFGSKVFVESAGLFKLPRDPFMLAVLYEAGIDFAQDEPHNLSDVECASFDLVVTLSPEAHSETESMLDSSAVAHINWFIEDVTLDSQGTREQKLDGYRRVRDTIKAKILQDIVPLLDR